MRRRAPVVFPKLCRIGAGAIRSKGGKVKTSRGLTAVILEADYVLTMIKLIQVCGKDERFLSRGVRYENPKWRFWPGAEQTYGSAIKPLHEAPASCCAQREDCKTSDNSENWHVSLVTAVFRELRLDSLHISSQLSYHQYWE